MTIIRAAALAAALGTAVLAGACTTTGTGSLSNDLAQVNAVIAQGLPAVCAAASIADASFQTVAATGKLSATVVRNERAAMAGVAAVCATPPKDAVAALGVAAKAYAAVVTSLNQAKAGAT